MSELIDDARIKIAEEEYKIRSGLIEKVEIFYDLDHNLYFLKVDIDYTYGGAQSAMIPLDMMRSYEHIKKFMSMFLIHELTDAEAYDVAALIKNGMIYGLARKDRYMIFYGLETGTSSN